MKLDDALVDAAVADGTSNRIDPSIASKINLLLARGAHVNALDSDGFTTLHWRAKAGDDASVRLLLAHGANPNLVSYVEGSSPLDDAIYFDHLQTALLLISHGAYINTSGSSGSHLLPRVTFNRRLPLLHVLIQNGARVDTQNNNGATPLLIATVNKWYPGMKVLLDAGASPNLGADDRFDIPTPLIHAASEGDAKATSLLLAHRANPNLANFKGVTALMMLAQSPSSDFDANHLLVARMLLAHGANVNARTKNGNTALNWAKAKGSANLIHLLKEAGATG